MIAPKLRCDNEKCDWEHQSESLKEAATWFQKKCPKCNESEIVNVADLMVLAQLQGLEIFGIAGEPGADLGAETVGLLFDTRMLRG